MGTTLTKDMRLMATLSVETERGNMSAGIRKIERG
jgi:hypothetical protein